MEKRLESIKKRLKAANKKAGRAMASMLLSSIFMAAIAQAFNWWYRKNEDEEDKTREFITDAVGNLLGGLPLIRNFYTYMTDGFEVESFAYISINDLFASFAAMFNLIGDALTSKPVDKRDIMLTFRKFLYSFGQITGIPTRNIYNVLYGTTNRISPEFAYKWNDNFYKQSYRADLAKAIESDDEDMIETIVGLMLNENIGNVTDSAVRKEMQTLVESGCDVIPKSVPETITYKDENGESQELVLTAAQTKKFKQIYTTANDKLSALLKLSQYKSASEEVRAKAIKFIYDTYYSIAINKLSGINDPSKNALFAVAIDIEELALITALAKSFTVDVKGGKTINGSRKAKVQAYVNTLRLSAEKKHMLMGYLGYSNKSGEEKVKAYINHLNLTKEQKQKLYEYCGY